MLRVRAQFVRTRVACTPASKPRASRPVRQRLKRRGEQDRHGQRSRDHERFEWISAGLQTQQHGRDPDDHDRRSDDPV